MYLLKSIVLLTHCWARDIKINQLSAVTFRLFPAIGSHIVTGTLYADGKPRMGLPDYRVHSFGTDLGKTSQCHIFQAYSQSIF